eukprot:3076053-Rhodomonas_salina.2
MALPGGKSTGSRLDHPTHFLQLRCEGTTAGYAGTLYRKYQCSTMSSTSTNLVLLLWADTVCCYALSGICYQVLELQPMSAVLKPRGGRKSKVDNPYLVISGQSAMLVRIAS